MTLLFEAMPIKMAKTETRQTLQIPGCQRRVKQIVKKQTLKI